MRGDIGSLGYMMAAIVSGLLAGFALWLAYYVKKNKKLPF